MNGIALARAIKADPALAPTQLILLTSFGSHVHSGEAQRAGFAADIIKPIRQSQLYDCIVTVMGATPAPSPVRPITGQGLAGEKAQWRTRVLIAEDAEMDPTTRRRRRSHSTQRRHADSPSGAGRKGTTPWQRLTPQRWHGQPISYPGGSTG